MGTIYIFIHTYIYIYIFIFIFLINGTKLSILICTSFNVALFNRAVKFKHDF